ncbi:MAG: transglycosylase SLT domain-containing protein [bacterium]
MGEDVVADRREHGDRREHQDGNERRGGKKPTSRLAFVLRSIGLIVILLLVIVYTFANTRPIYATRGTIAEELRKHAPGVAAVLSPADSANAVNVDRLMATPKFQKEKQNFYEDLMRLKQVDSARADSIAEFAVREAYVRGISPAIIFGVMLTENAKFVSKATSNVGAVGLMQVYPKIWLNKEMTTLFGKDIATDSTNVKYGVFILSKYFRPMTKNGQVRQRDWQTALLRYNGCVKGTNTPRCHTYPSKVQKFVEGSAKSICDGRGFYDCIAKPFINGLFGATNGDSTTKATR